MDRTDQLARVMMERMFDGILIEAAELDPEDSPTEVERLLERSLLSDLLEAADMSGDPTEWDDVMAMLRAQEASEDLQEVAVRIEARLVLLKR